MTQRSPTRDITVWGGGEDECELDPGVKAAFDVCAKTGESLLVEVRREPSLGLLAGRCPSCGRGCALSRVDYCLEGDQGAAVLIRKVSVDVDDDLDMARARAGDRWDGIAWLNVSAGSDYLAVSADEAVDTSHRGEPTRRNPGSLTRGAAEGQWIQISEGGFDRSQARTPRGEFVPLN